MKSAVEGGLEIRKNGQVSADQKSSFLLFQSISESFTVIGPAMCEPIAVVVLETDPPPTPPFIPTPAAPAG